MTPAGPLHRLGAGHGHRFTEFESKSRVPATSPAGGAGLAAAAATD